MWQFCFISLFLFEEDQDGYTSYRLTQKDLDEGRFDESEKGGETDDDNIGNPGEGPEEGPCAAWKA